MSNRQKKKRPSVSVESAEKYTSISVHGKTEKVSEKIKIRNTPILWGLPMDEVLFSKFLQVFFKNSYMMPWDGFAFTESTYLPDARNTIHKSFITDCNHKYLMMLDSDIMFPPHTAERLMAHNLPVVCGWYKNKAVLYPPHPIVYDYIGNDTGKNLWKHRNEPGKGLEKVDGVGMGCMLMSREVAITLGTTPYNTQDGGEDLNVCYKMREAGIPIYVDWDINCAHIGVRWV